MRDPYHRDRGSFLELIGMLFGGGFLLAVMLGQLAFVGWLLAAT